MLVQTKIFLPHSRYVPTCGSSRTSSTAIRIAKHTHLRLKSSSSTFRTLVHTLLQSPACDDPYVRGGIFLFLAESQAAHTRSATYNNTRAQSSGRIREIPRVKKSTLSTRGLSRQTEELEEKYQKNRTNEACVLVRCIILRLALHRDRIHKRFRSWLLLAS